MVETTGGSSMLKKLLIALFTVVAAVNVVACSKGKAPISTRG